MRHYQYCTIGAFGRGTASCRRGASGASGCCSQDAASARRGQAPSWCEPARQAGAARRIAFVAPTAADARDVMVEGESGILRISPACERPRYEPSKRRITWPNGAIATLFSADEPERLRGPEHDFGLVRRAGRMEISRGLGHADVRPAPRGGSARDRDHDAAADIVDPDPVRRSGGRRDTRQNGGERDNLAPAYLERIVRRYQGTRLGRQELDGEILDDVPGALWAAR